MQGLNLDSVAVAMEKDFEEWKKKEKRQKRSTRDEIKDFEDYLKAMFEIESGDPTVRDILVAMTAEDVNRSTEINAVREAAMTCHQTETVTTTRLKRQTPSGGFFFVSPFMV